MASWPWIVPYKRFQQNMDAYPDVRRWFDTIKNRPAVRKAMDVGKELRRPTGEMSEEQRKLMFGQTGASVLKHP
jgi:GST-like protein